ncbi:uncharacterized protein N7458_006227 [Penicillium daleae]|uniref:Cytochrome c oxidase assembly factor 3 n=1 Tax=Penicillium daleae TaxID=63821 RepID=A0AAD6C3Y2_9EURO|nr:uncharacterized protein N7458_006227 [Penicillium daleae]KAJ5449778.1 hypothetical protein N7458_006227 [Penicillium daleae]
MATGIFNSTYYGKDYRAGAALLRARRPYLFKNALTGFGLFAFSIGVCTYLSISSFTIEGPCSYIRDHPASCHSPTNLGGTIPQDTSPPTGHSTQGPFQDQFANHDAFLTNTDAYTISAVGQEEFSDVKVPDAPTQKLPAQK